MLDEQDKSTLIGALQYIIRRLQMDIDDGSRPDQWSMEDLVRVANDALKAQQPAPVDADEIERLTREIADLKADRDSWIEQASQRAQETVEAMQQVEAYWLRCEALRVERDQARAMVDSTTELLTGIHRLLYPSPVMTPDGRTMVFRPSNPDPHEVLQELSNRIRALPDEVAKMGLRCEALHSAPQPFDTENPQCVEGNAACPDCLARGTCLKTASAPREPLTDEQIANAARWRYWRNYWPALCRMEVARFAGLDLRTTYVQDPAGMDRVTDEAMTRRAHNSGADAPSKE